jgi:hypothetical protein
MPFPDPSLIPPPDRLSSFSGTVLIALTVLASLVWAGALVRRFLSGVDKPGAGAVVFFLLACTLALICLGDVVALRLLGETRSGVVTEADGFTVTTTRRGRPAGTKSYVLVKLRDEQTGDLCADTTTPAAIAALEADPALRLPFQQALGLCQVGLEPSLSRAGAGMLGFVYVIGLLFALGTKRAASPTK